MEKLLKKEILERIITINKIIEKAQLGNNTLLEYRLRGEADGYKNILRFLKDKNTELQLQQDLAKQIESELAGCKNEQLKAELIKFIIAYEINFADLKNLIFLLTEQY